MSKANRDFTEFVLRLGATTPKEPPPWVDYVPEADFLEVIFVDEEDIGDPLEPGVMILRGRENGEIVGVTIGQVRKKLMAHAPGLAVEMEEGRLPLEHLLSLLLWLQPREPGSRAVPAYRKLIAEARRLNVKVELPALAG
jgi:hypothetical protein